MNISEDNFKIFRFLRKKSYLLNDITEDMLFAEDRERIRTDTLGKNHVQNPKLEEVMKGMNDYRKCIDRAKDNIVVIDNIDAEDADLYAVYDDVDAFSIDPFIVIYPSHSLGVLFSKDEDSNKYFIIVVENNRIRFAGIYNRNKSDGEGLFFKSNGYKSSSDLFVTFSDEKNKLVISSFDEIEEKRVKRTFYSLSKYFFWGTILEPGDRIRVNSRFTTNETSFTLTFH